MKKLYVLFLLNLFVQCCMAQNAANMWYFGYNAGLDFNSGAPVPVTNGQLNTLEGCASLADPVTGQILMYTDGIRVWDKTHNIMPSNVATPLLGDASSTMSGVIVPQPGNPNIYYIFTTPAQLGLGGVFSAAMCYSIVDLSLNGGNGDVTTFNVPIMDSSVEKVAAIGNCNGTAYWVVGHKWGSDTFYTFKLTASGLSAPVKTAIGTAHQDVGFSFFEPSLGYMKFSSDGKKLGLVISNPVNTMEVFDFNFITGAITNPMSETYTATPPNIYTKLYGCSFSPDNSKFYVSTTEGIFASQIYQYNMAAGNHAAILASKTLITELQNGSFAAMQNAPDGKMYVSVPSLSKLAVISNPNDLGTACNYALSSLNLSPGVATYGLPCIVENFLSGNGAPPQFIIPSKLAICKGDTIFSNQMMDVFTISPHDGFYLYADHSGAAFAPSVTTTYMVMSNGDCGSSDTTRFTIFVDDGPTADFSIHPANPTTEDKVLYLQNESSNAKTYQWRDSVWILLSQDLNYQLPNPGKGEFCYKLIAIDSLHCRDTAEKCVTIKEIIPSKIFIPNAFSPNGDGTNDEFKINGVNIRLESFTIFNRFGQKVFYTNNINKGWDGHFNGKLCDLGTYFYQVKYTDYNEEHKVLKSDVELLR